MKDIVKVGVIGIGRVGKLHVENLVKNVPGAQLIGIADINIDEDMKKWASKLENCNIYSNPFELINNEEIDMVVISSSTNTHVDYMIAAAKAKKDIFLEKPIDIDIERAIEGIKEVEKSGVKVQMGYVRRFDHNYRKVKDEVSSGKLGKINIIKITSKDPCQPPFEYAKISGGLFMDMSIHDFDMARFLSGSEVDYVSAFGDARLDARLEEIGDIDTATIMLRMKNGVLCIIDNIRKSGYGYDLRSEVQCENGCVMCYNDKDTNSTICTDKGIVSDLPKWFFKERFEEAFRDEMRSFVDDIINDRTPQVGLEDGVISMLIARAAKISFEEKRVVKISEIYGDYI